MDELTFALDQGRASWGRAWSTQVWAVDAQGRSIVEEAREFCERSGTQLRLGEV